MENKRIGASGTRNAFTGNRDLEQSLTGARVRWASRNYVEIAN